MARSIFGTQSSTSNTRASGIPQGTPGGIKSAGMGPGRRMMVGDEAYLWLLLAIELFTMGWLRHHFRRYHGG
jgi:hypothetical protein